MFVAKYRQVHVEYWQDGFVLDLTPEEKYFYIYLMTNSKTSQCGIYELPKRIIETETGYNRETVEKLLQRFIDYGKISYSDRTREIMLKNWINYNFINSPKVINCIEKELEKVKEQQFANDYRIAAKRLGYGIDTVCIDSGEEREEEREEEEKKNNIPFVEIVTYLNDVAKTSYRSTSKKTQSLIKARINEGFTLDDFKAVIDIKTAEWLTDSKMVKFLRPETLFGTKFESYLNQKGGSYDQPQFNIPEDGDKYNFGF
ncbi:conserved phage C-terminal domain-containing protein [Mesobacillus zeae]